MRAIRDARETARAAYARNRRLLHLRKLAPRWLKLVGFYLLVAVIFYTLGRLHR